MFLLGFIISMLLSFIIPLYLKNKYSEYNLNKISFRLISLLNILIYLLIIYKFNLKNYEYNGILFNSIYLLYSIISSSLATSFIIDVLFKELPDENNLMIGISLFILSIILNDYNGVITSIILFILFFIVSVLTNQFGMGDVKMMAMMGLGFNPDKILPFIFTSCSLAVIYSIIKMIITRNNKDINMAFGPFLIVSFLMII